MNSPLIGQIIVAIVAFSGAWLAHSLATSRDRKNKRREQRIGYLIGAYRTLESISNRSPASGVERYMSDMERLESAIADIQLFGSRRQIDLGKAMVTAFVTNGTVSLDDLLEELRKDLRGELQLEGVSGRLVFLRVTPPTARKKRNT